MNPCTVTMTVTHKHLHRRSRESLTERLRVMPSSVWCLQRQPHSPSTTSASPAVGATATPPIPPSSKVPTLAPAGCATRRPLATPPPPSASHERRRAAAAASSGLGSVAAEALAVRPSRERSSRRSLCGVRLCGLCGVRLCGLCGLCGVRLCGLCGVRLCAPLRAWPSWQAARRRRWAAPAIRASALGLRGAARASLPA